MPIDLHDTFVFPDPLSPAAYIIYGVPQMNYRIYRVVDRASIPCVFDNTDCAQFLREWLEGVDVRDAEGNVYEYSQPNAKAIGFDLGALGLPETSDG